MLSSSLLSSTLKFFNNSLFGTQGKAKSAQEEFKEDVIETQTLIYKAIELKYNPRSILIYLLLDYQKTSENPPAGQPRSQPFYFTNCQKIS